MFIDVLSENFHFLFNACNHIVHFIIVKIGPSIGQYEGIFCLLHHDVEQISAHDLKMMQCVSQN